MNECASPQHIAAAMHSWAHLAYATPPCLPNHSLPAKPRPACPALPYLTHPAYTTLPTLPCSSPFDAHLINPQAAGITHVWLPPPSQSVSAQGYMPRKLLVGDPNSMWQPSYLEVVTILHVLTGLGCDDAVLWYFDMAFITFAVLLTCLFAGLLAISCFADLPFKCGRLQIY